MCVLFVQMIIDLKTPYYCIAIILIMYVSKVGCACIWTERERVNKYCNIVKSDMKEELSLFAKVTIHCVHSDPVHECCTKHKGTCLVY